MGANAPAVAVSEYGFGGVGLKTENGRFPVFGLRQAKGTFTGKLFHAWVLSVNEERIY